MLWQIRGGFWDSPWVFIHNWLRLAHKHWKRAWHSGTCARGASWYVCINVVQVSQLLHGQWVKTIQMFHVLSGFFFIYMARMKQRLACTAQAWRDITLLMWLICLVFRKKSSDASFFSLFRCSLVWVIIIIIIIHYIFGVKNWQLYFQNFTVKIQWWYREMFWWLYIFRFLTVSQHIVK